MSTAFQRTALSGSIDPLKAFKKKLNDFAARKRRGIRNPFVIVPVEPAIERKLTTRLVAWRPMDDRTGEEIPVTRILLDELLPETRVYKTIVSIPGRVLDEITAPDGSGNSTERVEKTMRDNLAREMVDLILDKHSEITETEEQIVLLLNLGSLYHFARASELLDEIDRRRALFTVGIPFPGTVMGDKLAFFGKDGRHYYPAHRIDQQIKGGHLQ